MENKKQVDNSSKKIEGLRKIDKYKVKNKTGRKYFDGKDVQSVIAKLEAVWALDGTDEEAAFYADISKTSLCRYLQSHVAISQRRDALRNNPVLKARQTVVNNLADKKDKAGNIIEKADPNFALRYLERKRAREFAMKQDIEHSGSIKNEYTDLSKEELERLTKEKIKNISGVVL